MWTFRNFQPQSDDDLCEGNRLIGQMCRSGDEEDATLSQQQSPAHMALRTWVSFWVKIAAKCDCFSSVWNRAQNTTAAVVTPGVEISRDSDDLRAEGPAKR